MMKLLPTITVLIGAFHIVNSANCGGGNNEIGEKNPKSKDNDIDTTTDRYYRVCAGDYIFDCCGIVNLWKYYQELPGTTELQIWRPNPPGSAMYDMVGSVSDTVPAGTAKNEETASANFIVMTGDCIGWHAVSTGTDMVTYKEEGGGEVVYYLPGPIDTSTTVDWSGAASTPKRNYAIMANVIASNAPTFASITTTYTISDNLGLSVSVAMVTFADVDGNDVLTITMNTSPYFKFDDHGNMTGTVSTHSTTPVNATSGTPRTLTFTATDLCTRTRADTILINIVNTPPVLSGLPRSVQESETVPDEKNVYNVTCTDISDDVTVSVESIYPPQVAPQTDFFFAQQIPPTTAWAIYERAQTDATLGQFDYNLNSRAYIITVACTDGKDTVRSNLTVNLQQNERPTIMNLAPPTSTSVNSTELTGYILFNITHIDAENDTVYFNSTCTPTPCCFTVLDSGAVQATCNLDTVIANGFDIEVSIKDAKNYGVNRILTVIITGRNHSPKFVNLPNTFTVLENSAIATYITTVSVTDDDVGDNHTYSMSPVTVGGDTLFEINPTTGVVSTKADINHELLDKAYNFTVIVSDGNENVSSIITINIGNVDEHLAWNSAAYMTDIPEGSPVDTSVKSPSFAITDVDANSTYYCIMDCPGKNGYYIMNLDCTIKVAAVYNRDLNTLLNNTVVCTVTAVDNGGNKDNTTLTFNVLDANNYEPRFGAPFYTFTVSSYAAIDTSIGTVTATDSDHDTFGTVTYTLNTTGISGTGISGNISANYFKVDGTSGLISTQVSMSVCNCSGYLFKVPVISQDSGGLKTTATVYITVLDVTTTSTTTTTDRFRTFFEDPKNPIWFSLLMVLLLITICVTVFVLMRYVCCQPFCWGKKRYNMRPRRRVDEERFRERSREREQDSPISKPPQVESIRHAPPPKGQQSWRHEHKF